jgi:hypothetical protein
MTEPEKQTKLGWLQPVAASILVALFAGGTAPWWWEDLKSKLSGTENNTGAKSLTTASKQEPSVLPAQQSQTSSQTKQIDDSRYYVITRSTSNKNDAIDFSKSLSNKGYNSQVILSTTGAFGVTAGDYTTEKAANSFLNEAKAKGDISPDAFVMPPSRWKATVYP